MILEKLSMKRWQDIIYYGKFGTLVEIGRRGDRVFEKIRTKSWKKLVKIGGGCNRILNTMYGYFSILVKNGGRGDIILYTMVI